MRITATLALAALGTLGFAQIKFDDLTKKNMSSPQWDAIFVGSQANFNDACSFAVTNYNQWQQMWPYIAGPYYQRGMQAPPFVDWNNEQIVFISLGNLGVQGYGLYIEDVRQSSSFGFDVRYVITRPSVQYGFNFGMGTTPFIAMRVPRSFGIPNFYCRYYEPPSYYAVRNSFGCNRGNQVWMLGAGGVLLPYTPPGGQQQPGQGDNGHGHGGHGRGGL